MSRGVSSSGSSRIAWRNPSWSAMLRTPCRRPAFISVTWYHLRPGSGRTSTMQLLYDPRDDAYHERVGSQVLYWLDDLDAVPLDEADPNQPGFLFAGARPLEDYGELV